MNCFFDLMKDLSETLARYYPFSYSPFQTSLFNIYEDTLAYPLAFLPLTP